LPPLLPPVLLAAGGKGVEGVILSRPINAGDALVPAEIDGNNRVVGYSGHGVGRGGRGRSVHGKLLRGDSRLGIAIL
jgi:hypothetical protein